MTEIKIRNSPERAAVIVSFASPFPLTESVDIYLKPPTTIIKTARNPAITTPSLNNELKYFTESLVFVIPGSASRGTKPFPAAKRYTGVSTSSR